MLLYRHIKPNGQTFYIGVGNNIRPYTKSDRNNFWWKVVKKYGYEIQILKRNLTKEEAYELEVILISWYGRRDLGLGYLVNLTDGGDGSNNVVVSEETREKLRIARLGHTLSEETKLKISNSHKGKIVSEETRLKMSESAKKKIFTEEHYNKLHTSQKGENNGMFGKTHSDETRDKIRQKAIGRKLSDESKSKISKLVLHLEMGIFFTSITEASELLNIPLWSFGKQIRNETPNKTGCVIV